MNKFIKTYLFISVAASRHSYKVVGMRSLEGKNETRPYGEPLEELYFSKHYKHETTQRDRF